MAQAHTMQQEAAGTEHLILAFAHIQESVLAQFFAQRGIFAADVQRELNKMNGSKNTPQDDVPDGQYGKNGIKRNIVSWPNAVVILHR